VLLPSPGRVFLTRIKLEWGTDDGIFVRQDGQESYRHIRVQLPAKNIFTMLKGELNSTKIPANANKKDIQTTSL